MGKGSGWAPAGKKRLHTQNPSNGTTLSSWCRATPTLFPYTKRRNHAHGFHSRPPTSPRRPYLFASRDSVVFRMRNLDAVREKEAADAARKELEARVQRIRSNPDVFRPFPEVPAATAWLANFSVDRLRYPVLVVLGASATGKTEWAKSLFKNPLELKVGKLEYFPERMRSFARGGHDGLVLDDVRDLQFLVDNQDKLQGKYDALVEFASTPGGQLSYCRDLFAVPCVVAANYTTKNLNFLETNDWLRLPVNRVLVKFPPPDPGRMED